MPLFDSTARAVRGAADLRRRGDAPGAIDVLAEVLLKLPDDVAANVEMARALRILGDSAGAEEHLRRALAGVLDYQLVVELAGVLAEQNRVEEAEASLDGALAMARGNPRLDPGEALLVRAAIAAAQGRDDDARAALDAIERRRAKKLTLEYARRIREQIDRATGPATLE